MKLKELRDEAWGVARETATIDADRLWTKAEMNRYINRVYEFIAKDTKCIRDDITPEICRITVAPPTNLADLQAKALTDVYAAQDLAFYNNSSSWLYQSLVAPYSFPLDYHILDIDDIKWTAWQWRLKHTSVSKWQVNPYWEQVIGMPTEYATDLATDRLNLNFRATSGDTLRLCVRRLPLHDLVEDDDEPEFRRNYHRLMLNGILWQMYSKQDAETVDKTKADQYYALYLKDIDEIKQQDAYIESRLRPNYSMDAFR